MRRDDNIARLDIAVNNACRVHRTERIGELGCEVVNVLNFEGTPAHDLVFEARAVDEFGHNEGLGVVDLGVQHPCNRGVGELLKRGDLADEPGSRVGVHRKRGVEHFQRHGRALAVDGLVHGSARARPEPGHDQVAPDLSFSAVIVAFHNEHGSGAGGQKSGTTRRSPNISLDSTLT